MIVGPLGDIGSVGSLAVSVANTIVLYHTYQKTPLLEQHMQAVLVVCWLVLSLHLIWLVTDSIITLNTVIESDHIAKISYTSVSYCT